jgi:colicin import membrane protein
MPHADTRPAPLRAAKTAIWKSLFLHAVVLGLVIGLPYLHKPPEVVEPLAMQAVLVEQPVARKMPEPEPVPVEEPVPEPPQEMELPAPVTEPPKIALPKPPEKKPLPIKPLLKKPTLNTDVLDAEMQAMEREVKQAEEIERLRREVQQTAMATKVSANMAIVNQYRGLIAQRVETKWNRPLSARAGMVVTLRISILPGGEVGNVVPVESSGDPAFDASAVEAVRRSSPLPVPNDIAVFNQSFRNFILKFRPEDL